MNWSNFHTHSQFCHGEGRIESYVTEAIAKNMHAIGFSSHAPVPFNTDWHMRNDQLEEYISEIEILKRKHKKINIYSGLEVDYIPNVTGPNTFSDRNLDFTIGSVHYVSQFKNQENYCIDTKEEFEMALQQIFQNDIKRLVSKYYEIIVEMIHDNPPDIIGHLDLVKKLNSKSRYFSEQESWYKDCVSDVIKALSNSDCIVEVNTRGYYEGYSKELYPSKEMLEKCFEADIPVTISSDAHHPEEIDNNFEDAASVLLDIGYNCIYILEHGKWSPIELR